MASVKPQDDPAIYHLEVGTEVSAKYRGAFCEAQIKSVRKNVQYKVTSKKTGKSCQLSEDSIRGELKIGSLVECQLPDQSLLWQECTIQNTKDRSSYTVVFDDGDERTLTRGSLCLKGDRHYAKSETLDNLPLTDPENFGTPVLKMKNNRRRRPADDEYDDDSEEQRTPDREMPKSREKRLQQESTAEQQETSSDNDEDDDEKRSRWLADPLMGKVVIVDPNDKRKHWFPGLVVNPLCYGRHKDLLSNQIVVRSFKTGKFLRVNRSNTKEMTPSTVPTKLDSLWKSVIEDAQTWQINRIVPDRWRIDIKDILKDSDDDDESSGEENVKKSEKKREEKKIVAESGDDAKEREEEKKSHDFLEVLYKFMDDCDTPINKTPVLGYKDLDLYLLFNLVQKRKGSFSINSMKEWKQIYLDLGIPKPNPAAGYNVKTAYQKYLGTYEEYCASWKHAVAPRKLPPQLSKTKKLKAAEKTGKDIVAKAQDARKIKHKEKDYQKPKVLDLSLEGKLRGRSSPVTDSDSPVLPSQRRAGQRRRISESSSASDVTTPSTSAKTEKKKIVKGNTAMKCAEKLRSPGGPDSEPDDSSRCSKPEKKEQGEKRPAVKLTVDLSASKRIRRNSTSNVSIQYSIGDKLKVKYGQGKTFKLYTAKVLQVKQPDGPGEAIEYHVHYAGWNARHDEWIRQGRIVGLAEDKVPSSPAAGSGEKARRPKTPLSARASYRSREDVPPSPVLPLSPPKPFPNFFEPAHLQDDLPEFSVKPRVSSILKKNLTEEFGSAFAASNEEEERSTSPVLIGSHLRGKRPRSPPQKPEAKAESPPAQEMDDAKDVTKVAQDVDEAENEKETDPEITKDETSAGASPKRKDTKDAEVAEKSESGGSTGSSPSEESTTSSMEASSEDASTGTRACTPPIHHVRRTSGRRSKSPAYLAESWLSVSAKRRKLNSSAEKSRSPTPVDKSEDDRAQHSKVSDETASLPEKKTLSPIAGVSPSDDLNSKPTKDDELPAPATAEADSSKHVRSKGAKSRKKMQEKSVPDKSLKEESTEDKNDDDKRTEKTDSSQATEYDNFDEEAPSIALEKHHDTEVVSSPPLGENAVTAATPVQEESKPEPSVSAAQPEVQPTEEKKEYADRGRRRKIRKRKAPGIDEDAAKKKARETSELEEPAAKTVGDPEKSQGTSETPLIPPREDENISEAPSSNNCENDTVDAPQPPQPPLQHLPRTIPSHVQNAPSSSKFLLDNTPPTTPGQSPNYLSEEQDIETSQNSPVLDSDVMDVAEQQKDSGGISSSSGCDQQATDNATKQEAESQKDEKNIATEEDGDPPAARKKRRESSGKRTAAKGLGVGNEQDSESEEEQDNETNRRKRHGSGTRFKPKKKKSKARPNPPSAPPPLDQKMLEKLPQDQRIATLQAYLTEMRKAYHQLKQEVAKIDRKQKRAKRREREAEAARSRPSKSSLSSTVADNQAATDGKAKLEETV